MNDRIEINGRIYQKVNEKYQSDIRSGTKIEGISHPVIDVPKPVDADDACLCVYQAMYTLMAVYDWIEDNWDNGWLENKPQFAKKFMSNLDHAIKQVKDFAVEFRDNY